MNTPTPPHRKPTVHVSGVGGTAMVAGARLALEAGWEVRGSDNPLYPPTSTMVEALGIPVATGYAAENLDWNPDVVLLGNALSRGNPEVEAALERGLNYKSLPEWLKDVVLRPRRPVVLCGTHGKTTTTALTAFLLNACGVESGYLIGGQPLDFDHSSRLGPVDAPFVIEGDEYDTAFFDKRAKFFHYLPRVAVVTSLEFDHGDIYDTVEDIELAFQRMLRQIPASGHLVLCADAPRALALKDHAYSNVTTYGFGDHADWRIEVTGRDERFVDFTLHHEGKPWGHLRSPLHGDHNLQNAAAATVVCALHGVSACAVGDALPAFRGIKRRMEIFLEAQGVTFIDDFAHHPTAIRETIAAAKTRWPKRRLIVLFEPRSNTTVTKRFQADLSEAFAPADALWLGPIYRAEKYAEDIRLDRQALAESLKGCDAKVAEDADTIAAGVTEQAKEGDIVLILSNGAFGGIYEKLKERFG